MKKIRPRVLEITLRADRSGGPRYAAALCCGVKDAFELFLALPAGEDLSGELTGIVGKPKTIYLPRRKFDLASFFRLVRFIRSADIDLIHSHGRGAGVYARLAALLTHVPVVHTFHGIHKYEGVLQFLITTAERLLCRFTTVFVCLADGEADEAVRQGIACRDRVVVIRTGVECRPGQARRSSPRLLHYSRFDEQKNFSEFLEIAQCLDACAPDLSFEVIGDGNDRERWMKAAADRGLDMTFSGSVESPEDSIGAATALISTSRWEGLPLMLIEAMRCGVPILASDVVGNNDLIEDGVNGRLYPLGDVEAAVRAYRDLAENGDRYARAAAELVKRRYSYSRMIAAHRRLYKIASEKRSAKLGRTEQRVA